MVTKKQGLDNAFLCARWEEKGAHMFCRKTPFSSEFFTRYFRQSMHFFCNFFIDFSVKIRHDIASDKCGSARIRASANRILILLASVVWGFLLTPNYFESNFSSLLAIVCKHSGTPPNCSSVWQWQPLRSGFLPQESRCTPLCGKIQKTAAALSKSIAYPFEFFSIL